MVKAWIKQLIIINKNSKINFDKIILDIFDLNLQNYDIKILVGYHNLYRLRIGIYRIIFEKIEGNIKILFIGKRGDVYKWLRNR